jgi:ribose transport system permease protein
MKKELGITALLVLLCVMLAVMEPNFLGPENVHNMLKRISMFGVFGIGCGVVIITGGIDLSIGSALALQGVVLCMLLRDAQWAWPFAVLATIGGLMVLGACHGLLITRAKLQPFIVTLCGYMIFRGMARYVTKDFTQTIGNKDFGILQTVAYGSTVIGEYHIPNAFFVLLVTAAAMYVLLHRSIYGRHLFAVGRNEEAARYSGISTRMVIGSAYVLCLALVGISGIILVFDNPSIAPSSFGLSYELYGIAAAVLGGCSLRGGEGSVLGIVLGTALLQVLQNLVNLLGISSTLEMVVMGVVILAGVMMDQALKSRKSAAKAPVLVENKA